jgi:hypothetical protein
MVLLVHITRFELNVKRKVDLKYVLREAGVFPGSTPSKCLE